jgi:multidrug resistance efflux pump
MQEITGRLKELSEAESQASALDRDLRKAEERRRLKSIIAPVAGTVQQLRVQTLGGMIQPGQALLAIVPDDSGIEIEAMVLNQDIGFVDEGQEAVIKLDAFPSPATAPCRGRSRSCRKTRSVGAATRMSSSATIKAPGLRQVHQTNSRTPHA